ncbi:MAG: cytochrome c biogenesis protein CcsA [Vicinamibacterales bacterium]
MLRRFRPLLLLLAVAMFASAPFLIVAAPNEATMGLVYKIIYFHVPSAILTLVSAIVCGVASAGFLLMKRPKADHWAVAAAELVVLFGAITLVTGPIWGRKAWGVWWVWDVRLTSTLLLWMVFIAYLLLRRFGGPGSDKLAAGMALFGMATAPFIYISVNVWRTLHPQTSVIPSLPAEMATPFWYCGIAFLFLYLALLSARAQLEEQQARIEDLYLAADEA